MPDSLRSSTILSAWELSVELGRLIDRFLDHIGSEDMEKMERELQQFLWDNKVGLLRVLEAHATLENLQQGHLRKRPVAWRVKDQADSWIVYQDAAPAYEESEKTGAVMQGLYIRDGF